MAKDGRICVLAEILAIWAMLKTGLRFDVANNEAEVDPGSNKLMKKVTRNVICVH